MFDRADYIRRCLVSGCDRETAEDMADDAAERAKAEDAESDLAKVARRFLAVVRREIRDGRAGSESQDWLRPGPALPKTVPSAAPVHSARAS